MNHLTLHKTSRWSLLLMLTLALIGTFVAILAPGVAHADPGSAAAAAAGGISSIATLGGSIIASKAMRALLSRKASTAAEMRKLLTAAEGRDLTPEETETLGKLKASLADTDNRIEAEHLLISAERNPALSATEDSIITGGEPAVARDPKRGFKSFGEFARTVRAAAVGGNGPDQRLLIGAAAPTTFGNEGAGADGGFLVPPEFAQEVWQYGLDEDPLFSLTDSYTVTGNGMVFPKDETTPWGTDGIRAYWQNEAASGTQTKPKLGLSTQRLNKIMALVPVTDELLSDTAVLAAYITKKCGSSLMWKVNDAVLYGSGDGQPLGAISSGAVVTVAKDSGQATGTLTALNVANMVSRLLPGSFGRSVWLINNDVLPALFTLTLNGYPIYVPFSSGQGGFQGSPYGSLLGRPIMITQHAKAFSSKGDVQLHDLSYYRTIKKASGMEVATSMHLYFDADATAFRTLMRLDGAPIITAPVTPASGSANTLSPFIQLGAR